MISIIKEAYNVDDAINAGLEQLAVSPEEVEVEIIREAADGAKAAVKLTLKTKPEDEICLYLEGLLDRMGVDCQVKVEQVEGGFAAEISGKDSAVVIGYRGEVLDALQYIATIRFNKQEKTYTRISLDVEGYRSRRADTLRDLARRLADKAVSNNADQELEPMAVADRKIIHETLAEDERVTTRSEGEEPNRHVIISPKEKPVTFGTSNSFKKTGGTKTRSFGNKKRRF